MMTQKVIVVLMIICLAISVASILKFAERKNLSVFSAIISLFIPFFFPLFMANFFIYIYKKDFKPLAFPENIFRTFRFAFREIQIVPLIHTALIDVICEEKEHNAMGQVFQFERSRLARTAVEGLRAKIFPINKFT